MKTIAPFSILCCHLILATSAFATVDRLYCPQNHAYINIGMSMHQVLEACGSPMARQKQNVTVNKKIPVQQMIYSSLNVGNVYPSINMSSGNMFKGNNRLYTLWSLPSGSQGVTLEVVAANDKISNIRINGVSTNASSLCQYGSFQIGDDATAVINACGPPSLINNSYENREIARRDKPERWIYQIDQYQPAFSLVFVNGTLESIEDGTTTTVN